MQYIETYNFRNKKALIRLDLNVSLDSTFQIIDDTRIKKAIPTIKKILNEGGAAILMSHLGRPKGSYKEKFSLKHLLPYLRQSLNTKVNFAEDCVGVDAQRKAKELQPGELLLLEN